MYREEKETGRCGNINTAKTLNHCFSKTKITNQDNYENIKSRSGRLSYHSISFSDGWNSVDEIEKYAGDIGMTKIAICDILPATAEADGLLRKPTGLHANAGRMSTIMLK